MAPSTPRTAYTVLAMTTCMQPVCTGWCTLLGVHEVHVWSIQRPYKGTSRGIPWNNIINLSTKSMPR